MSYRDSSNQSGDMSQLAAAMEIARHGWVVNTPLSRDSIYDLVVELGHRNFQTVQVKTMCGNSIARVVDRSGEVVSKNGKTRNSLDYAEHGIDWLVGVHKETGECYFYDLENYSQIPSKSFSVRKYPPSEFPFNEVSNRHSKKGNT